MKRIFCSRCGKEIGSGYEVIPRKSIEKIRNDVVKIICDSKATFFVNKKNKNVKIPPDELLYELKAEICTNVERYFYNLLV